MEKELQNNTNPNQGDQQNATLENSDGHRQAVEKEETQNEVVPSLLRAELPKAPVEARGSDGGVRGKEFVELRAGTTRVVLLIGNFAIKVPNWSEWRLFLHGLLANMQEAHFSKIEGQDKLCPVLYSIPGGWLNVMPRAERMEFEKWSKVDIQEWIKEGKFVIPVENKFDSFGIHEGRMVAIDYGS